MSDGISDMERDRERRMEQHEDSATDHSHKEAFSEQGEGAHFTYCICGAISMDKGRTWMEHEDSRTDMYGEAMMVLMNWVWQQRRIDVDIIETRGYELGKPNGKKEIAHHILKMSGAAFEAGQDKESVCLRDLANYIIEQANEEVARMKVKWTTTKK
jgi:hypothetical protein